jgi:Protein of unknown function (DUF3726)
MIVSLAEITATAKRATRGCGHFLGIAEEMAYAIPWLCARGFDATLELSKALNKYEVPEFEIIEHPDELQFVNHGAPSLPALTLAPSAVDLLVANRVLGKNIIMPALAHPLLLMPFVAQVAISFEQAVSLNYRTEGGGSVIINFEKEKVWVFSSTSQDLTASQGQQVCLGWGLLNADLPLLYSPEQLCGKQEAVISDGCHVDDEVWSKLETFAFNTYVPASTESRMIGAGAGLLDND